MTFESTPHQHFIDGYDHLSFAGVRSRQSVTIYFQQENRQRKSRTAIRSGRSAPVRKTLPSRVQLSLPSLTHRISSEAQHIILFQIARSFGFAPSQCAHGNLGRRASSSSPPQSPWGCRLFSILTLTGHLESSTSNLTFSQRGSAPRSYAKFRSRATSGRIPKWVAPRGTSVDVRLLAST